MNESQSPVQNKQQALETIRNLMVQYAISPNEINVSKRHGILTLIMSYVGGVILCAGILLMLGDNWSALTPWGRVFVSLGIAALAYILGVLFELQPKYTIYSNGFFLISCILFPSGLFILLDTLSFNQSGFLGEVLILTPSFILFLISFYIFKRNLFLAFSIFSATALFFSLSSWITLNTPIATVEDWYAYRSLFVGFIYCLLGYGISNTAYRFLTGMFYTLGTFVIFCAAFVLSGYYPDNNLIWEALIPILSFIAIYLSIPLKSKSILIVSTFCLIIYIFKINAEYFSHTLGWSATVTIIGLGLMVVGYIVALVKRRHS